MDFGLAKERRADAELQKLTATGIILGTPEFMSPEQLRGRPLDPRTDVYSLALMTYEMLTGKLPFSGRTQQEMMIARLRSDPMPLRDAGPASARAVERVLQKAMQRDPGDRYQTAPEFATALAAAAKVDGEEGAGSGGSSRAERATEAEWTDDRHFEHALDRGAGLARAGGDSGCGGSTASEPVTIAPSDTAAHHDARRPARRAGRTEGHLLRAGARRRAVHGRLAGWRAVREPARARTRRAAARCEPRRWRRQRRGRRDGAEPAARPRVSQGRAVRGGDGRCGSSRPRRRWPVRRKSPST
jgi:hypothetical protein